MTAEQRYIEALRKALFEVYMRCGEDKKEIRKIAWEGLKLKP